MLRSFVRYGRRPKVFGSGAISHDRSASGRRTPSLALPTRAAHQDTDASANARGAVYSALSWEGYSPGS